MKDFNYKRVLVRVFIILAIFYIGSTQLFWRPFLKNSNEASAQTCVPVFSSFETQSCQTPWCDKCGSRTCSVASKPNQFCFLSQVGIGDLGGGSDRAVCTITGTTVSFNNQDDGRGQCTLTCINFL